MSGDFLQNLYLLIGFFAAFTAVMWLFTAVLLRGLRGLADDLKNCGSDSRRSIRHLDGDPSGGFRGLSREIRELEKGARELREEVRGLGKDMQEVKDLLGIETDFPPQRSRSGADDGGRDR